MVNAILMRTHNVSVDDKSVHNGEVNGSGKNSNLHT